MTTIKRESNFGFGPQRYGSTENDASSKAMKQSQEPLLCVQDTAAAEYMSLRRK